VEGTLPSDVDGLFIRNGPNPYFNPTGDYHW
jgi:carotenoid cleavage dioxygenase-like enzyme